MVQRENSSYHDDLINVLQPDYARLTYNITIKNDMQQVWGMHGAVGHISGPQTVNLSLMYYLDQTIKTPKEDIFIDLEGHLMKFIRKVDGNFTQRVVEPFGDGSKACIVRYEIILRDYDNFEKVIAESSRQKAYKAFTHALEEKLSED